ncbi:fumarylacetoacetate hydrolase family protein [Salibacterium aidingense]|uniref:fumarylacetoacetate hydrolase family protein n=1 Tax=Salibacterium aidingense TaxID=384933 RepID=UPI003BDF5756
MKLLTFHKDNTIKMGLKTEEGIIDMGKLLQKNSAFEVPATMAEVIEGGEDALYRLQNYVSQVTEEQKASAVMNEKEIDYGPPVVQPEKIICVGLNYHKHAEETGAQIPETPILFSKFNNTLTGHKKNIKVPNATKKLDYEVELGIIMGKEAKDVTEEEALDYVLGYTPVNDLSARDLQFQTSQWLLGKTCDDFSPLGPYVVTADEVGDPQNLSLKTLVNGEEKQHSNTADMIFSCAQIISYVSHHMTLKPGDVIMTGTPSGVILGLPEEQQNWIKPGDNITVQIEKLGQLSNTFI